MDKEYELQYNVIQLEGPSKVRIPDNAIILLSRKEEHYIEFWYLIPMV